jgi:hypothetical protein
MTDAAIKRLATKTHITSVEAIKTEVPEWDLVDDHGVEVLALIVEVNNIWKQDHKRKLQENKAQRKQATLEKK